MEVANVLHKKVPAQRYDFPRADIETIVQQVRSLLESHGFLTMGKYGDDFEAAFAAYAGARNAVAVNSGTGALEIIMRAIDVAGADVIVPTNTFAATAFAAIHAGANVIFADCAADLSIDPVDVERRLTPNTKAVVTVHIGGLISPSVLRLKQLCALRGIALIEDAAHAHGSRLEGQQAGSFGDAAAFSFFSTKLMTTGEGGMVVTNRDDIARDAKLLRDQAKVSGLNRHERIGNNWRMTEFQAILGLTQLARLDEFIVRRRRIANIYDELFSASDVLIPLDVPEGAEPNYYKYVLFVEGGRPEPIVKRLAAEFGINLGGAVYDIPCHMQPVFAGKGLDSLPKAEDLCQRHICPPIYPSLTDADASYVAESILEVTK
jgi:dTDP-4-amino-4,6-dideoxygalactose transaminase